MGATTGSTTYREVTNDTGRVFRVGETPNQILGYPRWVVILAAWVAMCLAGLLEYTWGALSGSLQAAYHWGDAPTYWALSFFIIFESFIQIAAGMLRERGLLNVRWATMIGGLVCGALGYTVLATSTSIWMAYVGYAFFGGIGSGAIYSSAINIVGKWYPEKKGWRTGFVNGGWAYGAVPFILVIGAVSTGSGVNTMSASSVKSYIILQGIIMTVGIGIAGFFMKDPPKNWWPQEIDPLNWHKRSTRDLRSNPPAPRHLTTSQMWRTPQAKWIGIQFALFVGSSLFGVGYYVPFALANGLGVVGFIGFAGFALADGIGRPIYGYISEYIGRQKTMAGAYAGNMIFTLLAYFAGVAHNAPLFALCAVISGGLSGANFPMTAAIVADYYGETYNASNYGSAYAFKALGGSFAGGGAALVMTGTLYGTAHFHWLQGFLFDVVMAGLAALIVWYLCKRPTLGQVEKAVGTSGTGAERARPAVT